MAILGAGYESIPSGQAVFVKPQTDLDELRAATKRAVDMGCPAQPFVVTREEERFSHRADEAMAMLGYRGQQAEDYSALEPYMTGEADGALRCVVLWDEETRMGVLLHSGEDGLIASCMPLVKPEASRQERALAQDLSALAAKYEGCHIRLTKSLSGRLWTAESLLRRIRDAVEE